MAHVLKNALHPVRATSGHPSRHQLEENHAKTENVLSHFRPQKSSGLPNIQPISTKINATTLQISFVYCSCPSSFCKRKRLINMLGDLFLGQPVSTNILVGNLRLSIELFEQQGLRWRIHYTNVWKSSLARKRLMCINAYHNNVFPTICYSANIIVIAWYRTMSGHRLSPYRRMSNLWYECIRMYIKLYL